MDEASGGGDGSVSGEVTVTSFSIGGILEHTTHRPNGFSPSGLEGNLPNRRETMIEPRVML